MKLKKFNFQKVISTNNTAISIIKRSNLNHGMIISQYQKSGRGQYGRKWISFKGNLFASLFYNLDAMNTKKIYYLNLAVIHTPLMKMSLVNTLLILLLVKFSRDFMKYLKLMRIL